MKHNLKPKTDIIDAKDSFYLFLDLPGICEKDLSLDVNDNILSLKAEENLSKAEAKRYHVRSYEAHYEIDESIDAESIKAKLDQGVLKLELPKIKKKIPSKIKIQVA